VVYPSWYSGNERIRCSVDRNGSMNRPVAADFQKYLVDEQGQLIGYFAPAVDPMSEEIKSIIGGQ